MTDQDACRVMADKLWQWAAVPKSYDTVPGDEAKEEWISEIANALRNHTALPDLVEVCLDATLLEVGGPIRWRDLREKAKKARAKAEGRKE